MTLINRDNEWLVSATNPQGLGAAHRADGRTPKRLINVDQTYWGFVRSAYLRYLHGYATGHHRCECPNIEKRRFRNDGSAATRLDERMVGSQRA